MAKKSDYVTLKWWKTDSQKYSLDDLFDIYSPKRKELVVPISYNYVETRASFGHTHNVN